MPKTHRPSDMFASEAEAYKIIQNFRLIGAAVVSVLIAGTVFYHVVEDLRWIDAFYYCVVSLTTVGYGDFTPKTDVGKLFTVAYLIIGIAIIAAFINNLIRSRLAKRALAEHRFKKQR